MLFFQMQNYQNWQLSLGWELHHPWEVTEKANALDGFRMPTAVPAGQASGQPCSKACMHRADIPSLELIPHLGHRKGGQGMEEQSTPKQHFENRERKN